MVHYVRRYGSTLVESLDSKKEASAHQGQSGENGKINKELLPPYLADSSQRSLRMNDIGCLSIILCNPQSQCAKPRVFTTLLLLESS